MKKQILSITALIVIMLVALVSCKKSDTQQQKTNTELVSQSAWKYDTAAIDGDNNGTAETSLPAGTLDPCETDNLIIFNANGNGTIDEGATKCDIADPQTLPFTWTFQDNETTLTFSSVVFAGLTGDFKIITLNGTQLVLSKVVSLTGIPIPVTVIITFKH